MSNNETIITPTYVKKERKKEKGIKKISCVKKYYEKNGIIKK